METERLQNAREFEKQAGDRIGPEDRPAFHLSPRCGWLNDPNGFSFYNGKYHLFYQYYPYDSRWNSMHWGHAVSEDLLHWEYLPCAMAPDRDYDIGGVFSGSAITLDDGRHLLAYTGLDREIAPNPDSQFPHVAPRQIQCLAIGDGREYEKYEGNPVLTDRDLPTGGNPADFRDPKLFRLEDGSFRMLCANRAEDGAGQLLLYGSEDGFSWSFIKVFYKNGGRYGIMWECPDFFVLDGKGVLLVSPMDMMPEGFEFHNGNGNLALIGSFDRETETFRPERAQAVDSGIDFYASQTMLTPDGRRIIIAWMQNPDCCSYRGSRLPWYGQMTIPRELEIRDGRLWQRPVRELDALRSGHVSVRGLTFSGECSLAGINGRRLDLEVRVRVTDPENPYHKFILRFAQNKDYYTQLSFRPRENVLKLDRKFSGTRRAVINQRRCLVRRPADDLKLRVILDRYSVEVFINDGEQVMTALLYTDQDARGVMFYTDGESCIDVDKYDLID